MKALATLLTLFVFSFSFASVKEFLDNSVIMIENPTNLQTDTHSVYFGGRYTIKTPSVNFQPFQVTAPSIKSGCGGIDIAFGAFSYFNVEYLVNFLKATAAQAPAFAFQTAVQTLCPQCAQTMTKLTQLANSINGLNFNSCQAAQQIGSKVAGFVADKLNKSLDVGTSGPDWLTSFNEVLSDATNFINNDVKNMLTADGCNPEDKRCYAHFLYSDKVSFLEYALADVPYIGGDTDFQNIVRSMVGDIIKRGNGGIDRIKLNFVTPNAKGGELARIISGIAFGEGSGFCQDSFTYRKALDNRGGTVVAITDTLCKYVISNLNSIVNKLRARQPLDSSELEFLSMFKVPVYQIFNTLSLQPGALEQAKDQLAVYLTYELEYDILSSILSNLSHTASKLVNASKDKNIPIDENKVKEIMENITYVLQHNHRLAMQSQEYFAKNIRTYFDIQKLRAMLMASLARHPMMDSRLYSQSLLGF